MNVLEQRGLLALLAETVFELKRLGYGGVIANGWQCPRCFVDGPGTSAPHADNCSGVALLRDIEDALKEHGRG